METTGTMSPTFAWRPWRAAAALALGGLAMAPVSAQAPAAGQTPAAAQTPPGAPQAHRMVRPTDLVWQDVPSLPAGAKLAVIEGSLSEAAPFTVRLRFPANYRLPPHHHPAVERVTVLSGTFNMGVGERFDPAGLMGLEAGSVMIMQPRVPHFATTNGETIVQLHGQGPWGVTYVNPSDDPRRK